MPTRPGDVLDRYFNGLEKAQEGSGELAPLRDPAAREEAAGRLRVQRRRNARSRSGGAGT